MADLFSPAALSGAAGLLAPAIIILGIRNRVVKGSLPDIKEQLLAYAAVSVAYVAAATPVFHVERGITLPVWLWSLLFNVGVPAGLGITLAYMHQVRLLYRVAEVFRLRVFHHLPTAWDYLFESVAEGSYIIVRLTDGTEVSGQLGKRSFASSDKDERDLLIESVWDVDDSGVWSEAVPPRAILLCGGDIRSIEIM